MALVKTVRIAATSDWRAAAYMLERMDPANFSRRVEVTGAEGAPIQVQDVTAQIDAELQARSAAALGIPPSILPAADTE
jgi:hypothetical protein